MQVVTVPRQLVLVDEGIECVSGKLVQLARQRDRRQVAVHVRHVEAVGRPAVVGGKIHQVPELVMFKVEAGKRKMTVLAARGDVLPRGVGQQGFVLIAEAVVMVVRPAVEQFPALAPALRHSADGQHQSGYNALLPKAQHQAAGGDSQQQTRHPRQTRAGGKHRPKIHQELRNGHGEQRLAAHSDGVAARSQQVEYKHDNTRHDPVMVRGEELLRLAGIADHAKNRQHNSQHCAEAHVDILLPAWREPRHKQAEIVRAA